MADQTTPVTIKPHGTSPLLGLAELFSYRELMFFLVLRDLKVRYRQTFLGILWVVLQPVLTMSLYAAIFGRLVPLTTSVPYSLFVFTGLLPWLYLSTAISDSSNTLLNNANLINRVYFPRIILPLTRVVSLFLDFAVMTVILILLLAYDNIALTPKILMFPVLVFLTLMVAIGVGSLFSAINARYRDFHFVIPFGMQIWMFCTPVIYPVDILPTRFKALVLANPLTGLVEAYRMALLGTPLNLALLLYSMVTTAGLLFLGLWYFHHMESRLSDVL
jgi:lipopolysaccharide transport system permease protein